MGLGNTDISNFKPQRSQTAAKLLTSSPTLASKKDTKLQLRIQADMMLMFEEICKENGTDASKALRAYIESAILRRTL